MAGFVRRYGFFPGAETIALIEGVVIVDLPPPGAVNGVGVGTTGIIGEFTDVSSAILVSSTGGISSKHKPVEVVSAQDMINKTGGFDSTLGKFGAEMGNGFVAVRNKKFSRLILQAVNLASALGTRLFRQLPTNVSLISAEPIVTMQSAVLTAGTEFKSGASRARIAKRLGFTDDAAYASGIDMATTPTGLPAATQNVVSAGSDFVTAAVAVGDVVVLDRLAPSPTALTVLMLIGDLTATVVSTAGFPATGVILVESEYMTYTGITSTSFTGLARAQLGSAAAAHANLLPVAGITNGGTYRVTAIVGATTLTIEKQDGTNFTQTDWIATTAKPFRVHVARTADTGGAFALASTASYVVPARPLDATIANATTVSPTITPTAATQTTWDPLSGLKLRTHPTAPGLEYTAAIQGVNPANSASTDALYTSAIDAFLGQELPEREVSILLTARTSAVINNKMKSHVLTASELGVGRLAVVSPTLTSVDTSVVIADTAPGVGANRDERVLYSWPGAVTYIPEAVNVNIAKADGSGNTLDGIVDVPGNGWLAAVCSNLPPERNPGQAAPPVPGVLAPVLGIQRGVSALTMADYINLRAKGICGLRIDRTSGPIFQSGVTSSLISGQKNINRRRMADFIEDSLAQRLVQFAKLPLTNSLKDAAAGETVDFMDELLSPNNPAAQRINNYEIDTKSGNTPELEAKGIFVLITRVRTLATADFIVIQAEIGEGVVITSTL